MSLQPHGPGHGYPRFKVRWTRSAQITMRGLACSAFLVLGITHRAVADCAATSVVGNWIMQSTNTVLSGLEPPPLGPEGPGIAFTAYLNLAGDGTGLLEEQSLRGHRAADIVYWSDEGMTWHLGADCALTITGTLRFATGDVPFVFDVTVDEDGRRMQGIRTLVPAFSPMRIVYQVRGARL